MIETDLLNHFIGVASAGSFTRASQYLHVSQPVLSRSIKRLEDQVGTLLLERTSRKVLLTAAGQAFLSEAAFIVERLKLAAKEARRIGHGFGEKLRFGLCRSVDWHAPEISRAIRAFQTQWPNVQVDVSAMLSVDQPRALLADELDIGLVNLGEVDRTGLEYQLIASVEPCVAVPTSWNLPKTGVTLLDLRDRPWIIPHPKLAPTYYDKVTSVCRAEGFEPQIAAFAEEGLAGAIQIACGCGAAYLEMPMTTNASFEGVEFIPLKNLPASLSVEYAIVWSATTPSTHIANFLQLHSGSPNSRRFNLDRSRGA